MKNKIALCFKTTDYVFPLLCLMLSAMSVITLFSQAEYGNLSYGGRFGNYQPAYTQIFATVIGLACAFVISCVDYRKFIRLWPLYGGVCWAMVLLTFIPGIGYAPPGTGSRSWIPMPFGMSFQPTEIAKISFILSLSLHLSELGRDINKPKVLLPVLLHILAPAAIVHFQGDDGTAMVFLAIGVIMLVMTRINRWSVAACGGAVLLSLPLVWRFLLSAHQKERIFGLMNPELYEDGIMYQQSMAKKAFANGGLGGIGLFGGGHTNVPKSENDFIFSYFAESCGLIGAVLLLAVLFGLMVKILYSANVCNRIASQNSGDKRPAGAFICVGVFAAVFFQGVLNIAMNLMLLPVIGVTLPFVSAGGTSVLMLYICLGLVMSVSRQDRLALK